MIKLEDTNHPHLAGTAEIVTSRVYWALGYFVPETYLVTISGTGDERFDGETGSGVAVRAGRGAGQLPAEDIAKIFLDRITGFFC